MTTLDFAHNANIASGGAPVLCRTEGSNEFLQVVFRKQSDIPEAERSGWQGPVVTGDKVNTAFYVTID